MGDGGGSTGLHRCLRASLGLGWESFASTAGALGESGTLKEMAIEFMLIGCLQTLKMKLKNQPFQNSRH